MAFRSALTVLLALAGSIACVSRGDLPAEDLLGAYRFDDGRLVSVRRSVDSTLRARFYDSGLSRRLHPDGQGRFVAGPEFSAADPIVSTVLFERDDAGQVAGLIWNDKKLGAAGAHRVNRSETVRFVSDGATLEGRLDLPDAKRIGPLRSAVVLVHGSGADAATAFFPEGDFFAAHGIATLTYDKRGTGASEGEYTFDFQQLARDAVAAVEYLDRRPDLEAAAIGLAGFSQGAWVSPLAASMTSRIDFVIVSYGLVASPLEEARIETRQLLESHGVDARGIAEADELTRAGIGLIASDFQKGWEEFSRAKVAYRRAPWLAHLRGHTLKRLVRMPNWLIRLAGPKLAPKGLDWHYDSTELLEQLTVPTIWFLAEEDSSAPIELALPTLERLQHDGKPIEIRVFPGADHGMLTLPEGYAPGYFQAEVEAAHRYSSMTN